MRKYDFAKEFSKNPGLRFKKLSEYSGQEFRENVLEDFFKKDEPILFNVDGVESAIGASFLSESFGNMAVKYGIDKFNKIVKMDISSYKGSITNGEMQKRVQEALDRQRRWVVLSNIVAIVSLFIAIIALYKSSITSKEIFLNNIRENMKSVKHEILSLEVKKYEHLEQTRIIERFHDLTLYQGHVDEKKRYLNKIQQDKLFSLQEEIEDCTSCILKNCDIETNRNQIKQSINNFLEKLWRECKLKLFFVYTLNSHTIGYL